MRPHVLPLLAVFVSGCVHDEIESSRTIELESPRTTAGLVLDEPDGDGLEAFWRARDAEAQVQDPTNPSATDPSAQEPEGDPRGSWPQEACRVVELPDLGSLELRDLIDGALLALETEQGFELVDDDVEASWPTLPRGADRLAWLRRPEQDRHVVVALRRFHSQKPLWLLYAFTGSQGATWRADPERDVVFATLERVAARLIERRASVFATKDLETHVIELGYADPEGALEALSALGIGTAMQLAEMPKELPFADLPLVVRLPAPSGAALGLVGERTTTTGEFGVSATPTVASQLEERIDASPAHSLLVLTAPGQPEQLSRVTRLLRDVVDRPARQIFVEGMVLEISSNDLLDLGVRWESFDGRRSFGVGSLTADGLTDTLTFSSIDARNLARNWSVALRTLVREGKAEILSRPSVITLDSRQATLRVGEDIPIATSQEGALSSNRISFSFKYLPTGILLNIRPRINTTGDEISMLVDTVVSAIVPGRDLEIRDAQGALLATAPRVSTRRVQTYARIANDTPFIIGGLVSRDDVQVRDKVPVLGDLPLLGMLFRSEQRETRRREVIIVLTPFVLQDFARTARNLPRDDEIFDDLGNDLFEDGYRIRKADVFDLRFLYDHERFAELRSRARIVLDQRNDLAQAWPYSALANGALPGEEPLVHRMIYEVVKRTKLDEQLSDERMIFMSAGQAAGYDVQFLERVLSRFGDGREPASFFEQHPGEALCLRFEAHVGPKGFRPARNPIPVVELVPCADRAAWAELLWRTNRIERDGKAQFAIVIQSPDDLKRLRRAVLAKRILRANGGTRYASFAQFRPGVILQIPTIEDVATPVIDAETARLFFHTEHYYAAAKTQIEHALTDLERALDRPDIRALLPQQQAPR